MLTEKTLTIPNVFHTGANLDGYELVTGSSPLQQGAKLLGLYVINAGADGYVQVFDGYAQPANNTVPILSLLCKSNTQVVLDTSAYSCVPVIQGIVVAMSSTATKYTAGSAAMFVTAFWI